ncbi:MAG TPA: hypothetical protein RMG45_23120, partial [Polyangiaceae bacterium LLY-WYZ-15_(1-7)]|nr:hypothetical protein [Polyangiaceae bacterium LLY-WYZ-15_(1-7)]
MRRAFTLALALTAFAAPAQADELDISLARFRGEASAAGVYTPDFDAYRRLMSQLGFALAPPLLEPARTTGYRGFRLSFDTTFVGIDDGADYWRLGTEGDSMATFAEGNRFVPSSYAWSQLSVRKGLPYGLEAGLTLGRPYNASSWVFGGSLKIALLEGFREGWPAFLPDFAVRGSVTTLVGESDFSLTVASADLILSKPLVAGSTVVLTPIVGA